MTPSKKRKRPNTSRTVWIVAAVVVAAAAVIAIAVGGGGGSRKTTNNTTAGSVSETRPVTFRGTPLSTYQQSGTDPAVGTAAPELIGQTFNGEAVGVTADEEPKVILMVAHWCPHCQREVPLLTQYFKTNGLPKGVRLVTVATDTNPNSPNYPPSAWLSRVGWPLPVMADDSNVTAAKAYGLSAFPFFVAVSADNKVVVRRAGELTIGQFNALLQAARTGTVPAGL